MGQGKRQQAPDGASLAGIDIGASDTYLRSRKYLEAQNWLNHP
jgi:hypothetical protein